MSCCWPCRPVPFGRSKTRSSMGDAHRVEPVQSLSNQSPQKSRADWVLEPLWYHFGPPSLFFFFSSSPPPRVIEQVKLIKKRTPLCLEEGKKTKKTQEKFAHPITKRDARWSSLTRNILHWTFEKMRGEHFKDGLWVDQRAWFSGRKGCCHFFLSFLTRVLHAIMEKSDSVAKRIQMRRLPEQKNSPTKAGVQPTLPETALINLRAQKKHATSTAGASSTAVPVHYSPSKERTALPFLLFSDDIRFHSDFQFNLQFCWRFSLS